MADDKLPAPVVGSVGGACSVLFTHPVDTMKVRAQAGAAPLSAFNVVGLYKGVSTPLVTVTAHWSLLYSGNRTGQDIIAARLGYPEDGRWHWQRSFLGGWTAGCFCSVLYTPVQAVKNTVQVHRCSNLEAIRKLYAYGGVRLGLYRGYLPALAYELPAFSAYFVCYDGLLAQAGPSARDSLPLVMACAAAASIVESTVGHLPDTVKTRYQSDLSYSSVRACIGDLYAAEGLPGFFRGFRWRLVWGVVLTTSAFGAIETLNGWWARRQASSRLKA